MGELTTYVTEQAAKKKLSTAAWLDKAFSKLPQVSLATHVGKFTHSGTNVFLYDGSKSDAVGYVITENADVPEDFVYTNANIMTAANLLLHPLDDHVSLYRHLKAHDPVIMEEMRDLGYAPEPLISRLPELDKGVPDATDGRLRQIYFPVGADTYHLLTVLPSSAILEAVRVKVDWMRKSARTARDTEEENYGSDYDDMPMKIEIGIGGANPQNVSGFSNMNRGIFYLLPALPPELSKQAVRRPKHEFFRESLPYSGGRQVLARLKEFILLTRNNKEIRDSIRENVDDLVDMAVYTASLLQEEPGWTESETYSGLPPVQKYWLDPAYRLSHPMDGWEKEIGRAFGRWLVGRCNRMLKENSIFLGDAELSYFAGEMEDVLTWGGDNGENISIDAPHQNP